MTPSGVFLGKLAVQELVPGQVDDPLFFPAYFILGQQKTPGVRRKILFCQYQGFGMALGACRTYPRAARFSAMLGVFRHKNGSSVGQYE